MEIGKLELLRGVKMRNRNVLTIPSEIQKMKNMAILNYIYNLFV